MPIMTQEQSRTKRRLMLVTVVPAIVVLTIPVVMLLSIYEHLVDIKNEYKMMWKW